MMQNNSVIAYQSCSPDTASHAVSCSEHAVSYSDAASHAVSYSDTASHAVSCSPDKPVMLCHALLISQSCCVLF